MKPHTLDTWRTEQGKENKQKQRKAINERLKLTSV